LITEVVKLHNILVSGKFLQPARGFCIANKWVL